MVKGASFPADSMTPEEQDIIKIILYILIIVSALPYLILVSFIIWVHIHTMSWANLIWNIRLTFIKLDVFGILRNPGTQITDTEELHNGQATIVSAREHLKNLNTESTQHWPIVNRCPGTINSLPNEVLEIILKKLPTKDLLNVRLISKRWLPVTTSVSRRRNVGLRTWWFNDPHGMDIFRIYAHCLPPWSSYPLNYLAYASPALKQQFYQRMGRYLLDARITMYSPGNLNKIIQFTPNLRSLEICLPPTLEMIRNPYPDVDADVAVGRSLPLANLKRLKMEIYGENLKLFEFLDLNGTQLQSLDIKLSYSHNPVFVHKLVTFLINLPSITLELHYPSANLLQSLAVHELKVQSLDLRVTNAKVTEAVTLISSVSQYLSYLKLKIDNIGVDASTPVPFSSSFPVLKVFEMECTRCKSQNFLMSFFTIFNPAQVPILKTFRISVDGLSKKSNIFNSRPIVFGCVTKLELSNLSYFDDNWILHFPNVKKMTVEGYSGSFKKILSTMTPLEHLILKMKRSRKADTKINPLFAGKLKPGPIYDEIKECEAGTKKLTAKVRRAMDFRAPLLSLTRLRTLELEVESRGEEDKLDDSGVYFSFLKLQPLELLRLRNVSISMEMEDQLREHHLKFVCE